MPKTKSVKTVMPSWYKGRVEKELDMELDDLDRVLESKSFIETFLSRLR